MTRVIHERRSVLAICARARLMASMFGSAEEGSLWEMLQTKSLIKAPVQITIPSTAGIPECVKVKRYVFVCMRARMHARVCMSEGLAC